VIQLKRLCQLLLLILGSPWVMSEDISIHLKWYHKYQFAGYYAAQQQGYFQDEDLTVRLIEGGPNTNHLHVGQIPTISANSLMAPANMLF